MCMKGMRIVAENENQKEQEKEILEEILEDLEEEASGAKDSPEEGTEEAGESSEASTDEEGPGEKDGSKESKKEKKKKEKLDKKQEPLKEKISELEDKIRRQIAEFDNFRKRTEKEKSAMFETGAKSVIEKILPIVDNFERGLAALPEEEKDSAFAQGMEMIYKQLMTELEAIDVRPIEAIGEEFNPEFHNAVMQVESEEYEAGMVAQELQKGYTYRGSVVRHSMVAVVQG